MTTSVEDCYEFGIEGGDKKRSRRGSSDTSVRKKLVFGGVPVDENATLRSELSSVHAAYQKTIEEKDEEIATLKKNIVILSSLFSDDIDSLNGDIESLQEDLDITEGELDIFQKSEKAWTGRAIKLKFILDEIKKVGALPKDHAEWVEPMVEDVDVPEVSIRIRDEFIPTAQTDNIDWTDEEEDERYFVSGENDYEEVDELVTRMTILSVGADRLMLREYNYPRAILERSARIIQKYFRGHRIV